MAAEIARLQEESARWQAVNTQLLARLALPVEAPVPPVAEDAVPTPDAPKGRGGKKRRR